MLTVARRILLVLLAPNRMILSCNTIGFWIRKTPLGMNILVLVLRSITLFMRPLSTISSIPRKGSMILTSLAIGLLVFPLNTQGVSLI